MLNVLYKLCVIKQMKGEHTFQFRTLQRRFKISILIINELSLKITGSWVPLALIFPC